MSLLLTFPGQGAQRPGMLHALPPECAPMLAECAAVLGYDPLLLDTEPALQSTRAVQLCLLIAGVATARRLMQAGAQPAMVAGFSIGEYAAAVIAGVISLADALTLVARRGELMEQAYPSGYGMAVVLGLDAQQLAPLVAQVHTDTQPVYIANLNAAREIVVSGSDAALEAVMALARAQGASCAKRLAVAVPSHCPLFDNAVQAMQQAFAPVALQRPRITYLSSSAARALFDPARIAHSLATNMASQVQWAVTMRLAWERGARLALEMPPGAVLTKLTAPLLEDGLAVSCDSTRFDTLLALAERSRAA